jgi:hypothetical protein
MSPLRAEHQRAVTHVPTGVNVKIEFEKEGNFQKNS